MTNLTYLFNGTDPTTVNSNGTAAAAITSAPAGYACTATSGGVGSDMRLASSATYVRSGSTALKITTASGVTNIIRLPFAAGNARAAVEFYYGADAAPGAGVTIAKIQGSGDVGPRIGVNPDGSVYVQDAAGATQGATAAGAWVAGRRNRIAVLVDNSGGSAAGTMSLRVFNDDSTTPSGTLFLTGKNLGSVAYTNMDIGTPVGTTVAWVEWFEDVQMGDGRTTEFGPYALSGVPPVVDAGADFTVDPNLVDTFTLTAVASDPDGTISSYTWDDLPAGATLAGSGPTRTPPVVRSIAGSTRAYRCTVQDNSGLFANDTVNVTFLPHTRWMRTPAGLVPLRRNT